MSFDSCEPLNKSMMYFYIIPAARWELGIQGMAVVPENSSMFKHNPCVRGCSRANCLLGCHAKRLELFTEREHRALAQLGPACSTVQRTGAILQFTPTCAQLESKHEWKRNFRSRTQIFLRAGRVSFVLLMLHRLSLNFSLFSSKYVLSHLFACLFCAGNTSPLDTLAFPSSVTWFGAGGRKRPCALQWELDFAPQIDHKIDEKCYSSVMARA